MYLIIELRMSGAAFEDAGPEVESARILRHMADCIERAYGLEQLDEKGGEDTIRDINGNVCGSVRITPEDD